MKKNKFHVEQLSVKENFKHWVYIYDVKPNDPENLNYDRVYFTGNNFIIKSNREYDLWYWPNSYLPWRQPYSYADNRKMRSSTTMVWYWQQYTEYDPTDPKKYSDIYTRYYDGTP